MDDLRTSLWDAIRAYLPAHAEAVQPEGAGNLVISWTLPTESRPNRQSREISVHFDRAVMRVVIATDDVRRELVAKAVARFVDRVLKQAAYDPMEEGETLVVHVDDRALE